MFQFLSSFLLWMLMMVSTSMLVVNGQLLINSDAFFAAYEVINDVLPWCSIASNAIEDATYYCLDIDGLERCYYLYIPDCAVGIGKAQLVVDMHALWFCPSASAAYSEWKEIAEQECFVVAWPLGYTEDTTVNCFHFPGGASIPGTSETVTPDCCCNLIDENEAPQDVNGDFKFLNAMLDDVVAQVTSETSGTTKINSNNVIITGHSNGGMASMAFAAQYSDRVACVASFAGFMITDFASDYTPVPLWTTHGTDDLIISYNGRDDDTGVVIPIDIASATDVASMWADQNNCNTNGVTTTIPNNDPGDTIITMYDDGCDDNANVRFVTIDNGGHWIYPELDFLLNVLDAPSYPVTQDAWNFCKLYLTKGGKEVPENEPPCPEESRCTTLFGTEGTPQYTYLPFFFSRICINICETNEENAISNEQDGRCGRCP